MVWSQETSNGFESDKIAAHVIQYTRGRGLDIGCGMRKVWPHVIGFDNQHHFGHNTVADIKGDSRDLGVFADGSLDFIFSSHMLEHVPEDEVDTLLKHWSSKLKVGGNLIFYVPSGNLYPHCQPELEPGANPDHKWDIYPGDIAKHLAAATDCGWTQLEGEERAQTNEYSLFEVYQKRDDGELHQNIWERNPGGKKRVLVIRYGGIGDHIITSSIFPQLKAQGYHVTYNTTPMGADVCKYDPNIDEWLVQDNDQVPNGELGPYWATIASRYDKVINLCESVEVALLARPDSIVHAYPQEVRHKLMNVNYLERTHDIAGVDHVFNPHYFMCDAEKVEIEKMKAEANGAPIVIWILNGSSAHKVYPWTDTVVSWLLKKTPAHIYLYADPTIGAQLQKAMVEKLAESGEHDMTRVHATAGVWPVRKCLSFLQVADVVVGPETGPLNAVSFEKTAKIIYLSHSSHENLTKHWKNTIVLEPNKERAPCFPCHRLHYDWTHCHQNKETGAALCASGVAPEHIFKAIADVLIAKSPKLEVA